MDKELPIPLKLIVEHRHEIIGRGMVYTLDLKVNGIGCLRKEFNKTLMGQNVSINDVLHVVKGIEAFATFDDYVHNNIGILVKEIK